MIVTAGLCAWCRDLIVHPEAPVVDGERAWHDRCLVDERDRLEAYFRVAVNALTPYLQAGGRYAYLMSPGESITQVGPARLVEHLEERLADATEHVRVLQRRLWPALIAP